MVRELERMWVDVSVPPRGRRGGQGMAGWKGPRKGSPLAWSGDEAKAAEKEDLAVDVLAVEKARKWVAAKEHSLEKDWAVN